MRTGPPHRRAAALTAALTALTGGLGAGCAALAQPVGGAAIAEAALVAHGAVRARVDAGGDLVVDGGPGYVVVDRELRDVVVRARVFAGDSNSGLFVRAAHPSFGLFPDGVEVQIERTGRPWSTGAIYGVAASAIAVEPGAWFTLCVVVRGDDVTVAVDGKRAAQASAPRRAGFVAVQGHDPTTSIRLRELRVEPLPVVHPPDDDPCAAAW